MAAPILVVSGPSGAGKTTVSRLVAAGLEPSVHIRTDDFLGFIVNGWIDPVAPESDHQNHVLGGSFTAAAVRFAEGGYNVVLDGHVFPEGLQGMTRIAARHRVAVHYVVLRPALGICLTRAAQRESVEGRFQSDADSITALHRRFSDLDGYEANVLEASKPPDVVADEVLCALADGRLLDTGT